MTFLRSIGFLFCFLLLSSVSNAQLNSAITWKLPQSSLQFDTELDQIQASGFSTIILQGLPSPQQIHKIEDYGLDIIVDTGLRNLHRNVIRRDKEQIRQTIELHLNHFRSHSSVKGMLLFSHGIIFDQEFNRFFEEEANRIRSLYPNWEIYIVTNSDASSIAGTTHIQELRREPISNEQIASKILIKLDTQSKNARYFRDKLVQFNATSFIWFEGNTLIQVLRENPLLVNLFHTFNTQENPVFAVNTPDSINESLNWEVPILLFLLIGYLIFFRYVLSYKKTLFRYFNSHLFFVTDILDRVVLLGKTVLFLLPVFGLLFAHIFTVSLYYFFGEWGMDTLSHHFWVFTQPWLVFIYVFFCFLIFNIVSILWISTAAWRKEIISQVSVLVIWPQHILIPLSFISLVIAKAGYNPMFSLIVLILSIIIVPLSFFIASSNLSTKPTYRPIIHKLLTLFLGMIVLLSTILLIHYQTDITAVLQLALFRSGLFG